ncbi:MAG: hypothetical protein ACP5LF_05500 [Nitrososphaeria archaeon]
MYEYKTALTLSLIGVAFQAFAWIFLMLFRGFWFARAYAYPGPYMGMMYFSAYGFSWFPFYTFLGFIVLALGITGIWLLSSGEKDKATVGSVLIIAGSVMAFPTMFGFMVGSLLMLIGGIMGLTLEPEVNRA